jgi:S1-C subfamily serine protease
VEPTATPVPDFTLEEIVAAYDNAAVLVKAEFPKTPIEESGQGAGSGVVYDLKKGLILTVAHNVLGANKISVALGGGKPRQATLLGASYCEDLAVLQVSDTRGLIQAPLGESTTLQPGNTVFPLGYPEPWIRKTLTPAEGRVLTRSKRVDQLQDVIEFSGDIDPGSSGSPVFNQRGQVVGIVTGALVTEGTGSYNLAVAISRAKELLPHLEDPKRATKDYIGLNLYRNNTEERYQDHYGMKGGMVVAGVDAGSPAYTAGIRPGDLLISMAGSEVNTERQVCDILRSTAPGRSVVARVFRRVAYGTGPLLEGSVTVGQAQGGGSSLSQVSYDPGYVLLPGFPDETETIQATPTNPLTTPTYDSVPDLADGSIDANVRFSGGLSIGLVARLSNDGDDFYVCWITRTQLWGCDKMVNGKFVKLMGYTKTPLIKPNGKNALSLDVRGSTITFYIGDDYKKLGSVVDSTHKSGRWGLYGDTSEDAGTLRGQYDDIRVYEWKEE